MNTPKLMLTITHSQDDRILSVNDLPVSNAIRSKTETVINLSDLGVDCLIEDKELIIKVASNGVRYLIDE